MQVLSETIFFPLVHICSICCLCRKPVGTENVLQTSDWSVNILFPVPPSSVLGKIGLETSIYNTVWFWKKAKACKACKDHGFILRTCLRVQGECEQVIDINWLAKCEINRLNVNKAIFSDSKVHAQHSVISFVSKFVKLLFKEVALMVKE